MCAAVKHCAVRLTQWCDLPIAELLAHELNNI